MSERKLIVFGASGHAKVVIEIARSCGYVPAAVLDDDPGLKGTSFAGVEVAGGKEALPGLLTQGLRYTVVAIGANHARSRVAAWLAEQGCLFPVLVHERAWVSPTASLGSGTVVMPGAIINADAVVGQHVIVNTSASIDHDCVIHDAVHIAPGVHLCGGVEIGARTLIGVGASVIPCKKIGADAVIGGGSAVVTDINAEAVVGGSPAHYLSKGMR
jgi:sugar O-acyltransferase (sialic acid O-acetyltransferase NeuD family)